MKGRNMGITTSKKLTKTSHAHPTIGDIVTLRSKPECKCTIINDYGRSVRLRPVKPAQFGVETRSPLTMTVDRCMIVRAT